MREKLIGLIFRITVALATRLGYTLVRTTDLNSATRHLSLAQAYVERSGHLNTVKGRKPRAVSSLTEKLWDVQIDLMHGRVTTGTGTRT
jgi:hypothetical protein